MKLSVEALNFSYADMAVIRELSFSVDRGEFISILGPSGCGKSTLLNVLAGNLTPQSGRIWIDGEEIHGVCRKFAYMPQNDLLLPWRTVLDNVCLYGEIHRRREQTRALAREQMSRFGLGGCENKYPHELSGGMRQRAAFLRTTLCEADIYLLDEPFGALDVITREGMQDWLKELCGKLEKTIILVTHDTDEAIYLSDRILVLGAPGEGIRREIKIQERQRTREWLYAQGELRAEIHKIIRADKAE